MLWYKGWLETRFRLLVALGIVGVVLLTLYSNGLLERNEYDELKSHLRLRNALIHGLQVPPIDVAVPLSVTNTARKLLAWDGKEPA